MMQALAETLLAPKTEFRGVRGPLGEQFSLPFSGSPSTQRTPQPSFPFDDAGHRYSGRNQGRESFSCQILDESLLLSSVAPTHMVRASPDLWLQSQNPWATGRGHTWARHHLPIRALMDGKQKAQGLVELETNTYLKPENLVSLSCVKVKTALRVSPREQDAHSTREVQSH